MKGPKWYTMQYTGSESSKVHITPNVTSDIYILKRAVGDPNNFVYDINMLGINGNTTIDANELGLTSA